jgi:hypothetical protein
MDSILADLPLGGPTLYTRTGNVFPWATLGLTLLLCVLAMRGEPKGLSVSAFLRRNDRYWAIHPAAKGRERTLTILEADIA